MTNEDLFYIIIESPLAHAISALSEECNPVDFIVQEVEFDLRDAGFADYNLDLIEMEASLAWDEVCEWCNLDPSEHPKQIT